jgi:ubiquinone/menaquinone biosynthesis C-methylase UbiE
VVEAYDLVSANYAERFSRELDYKPFDRVMLDWMVERTAYEGVLCDLGCGPGQIAGYLAQRGASVMGIDVSSGMLNQARLRWPDITFQQADMRTMENVAPAAFSGVVAFYSIIHFAQNELAAALAAIRRVLQPRGWLLLSFHVGDETRHVEEFMGQPVTLDFHLHRREAMRVLLSDAGYLVTEVLERDPYEVIELPTKRAYLWAQNQASSAGEQ